MSGKALKTPIITLPVMNMPWFFAKQDTIAPHIYTYYDSQVSLSVSFKSYKGLTVPMLPNKIARRLPYVSHTQGMSGDALHADVHWFQ